MILFYLCISFVLGVYIGSMASFPPWAFAASIIPLLFIPLLRKHKSRLFLSCFCIVTFAGGNLCYQSSLPIIDETYLQYYNDKGTSEIEGLIINEPEPGDRTSSFQLSVRKMNIDGQTKELSGKALVRVPRYSEYHYGDLLRVKGKLETPPLLDDFNYKDYLAHQGICSIINFPRIETLQMDTGFPLFSFIYSLRNSFSRSLSYSLPEPHCSLARGMLLGLRGNIPDALRLSLVNTGTTHIIAISGLNLSIIIGILLSMGTWLFGRRYSISIWLAFAAIWLYVAISGMQPPVIRGAIMGSMFLFAEILGRQRDASTALIFAAAVMVAVEPQILWNVSFQLSFLSMAGLIFILPSFQSWCRNKLGNPSTSSNYRTSLYNITIDSLCVTSVAILATAPIIAYNFGTFSLVALPANFFALPSLPPIIITTAIVSITGLLIPVLAQFLGWVAWLFLSYFILVIQIFNKLPPAININNISTLHILSYYILMIAIVFILTHRNKFIAYFTFIFSKTTRLLNNYAQQISMPLKKWTLASLLIASALIWAFGANLPDDKLHVNFLNVGQGDAIFIQTPSHQNILIDGGPSPQLITLELSKRLAFWDRTIDLMILTQPQSDHVTGLVEVLQNYKVKQVIGPEINSESLIYSQWLKAVQNAKTKYTTAHAGQTINMTADVYADILNPPIGLFQDTGDINNNSLLLRVNYHEISFLLTADISEEVEWDLISHRANLRSTVLKVAHHGSITSTSKEILAVVDPEVAIISVGNNNPFNHPHPDVIARLTQKVGKDNLYLTSKRGSIELTTDGQKLWSKTEY